MTTKNELTLLNEIWEYIKKENIVERLEGNKESWLKEQLNAVNDLKDSVITIFTYIEDAGEDTQSPNYLKKVLEQAEKSFTRAIKGRGKNTEIDEGHIEKLKKLCQVKVEIKNLEEIKKLEKELDSSLKAEHIKSALNYILEIDKENKELRKEIEKLKIKPNEGEEKIKEEVKKAPNIPNTLRNKKEIKLKEESWKIEDMRDAYNEIKIHPDDEDLSNYITRCSSVPKQKLPCKLYKVEKGQQKGKLISNVEKSDEEINNYAILSYVWGGNFENMTIRDDNGSDVSIKMNEGGQKTLEKSKKICLHLEKINYLWMDQLCINQNNPIEKAKEVEKMGEYYSNAVVTLVAINTKVSSDEKWDKNFLGIIEKIIDSKWFSRSWTFQEGWLSKRTIFMFDDIAIDGAFLAQVWAFNQQADVDGKYISRKQLEERNVKIATPIGWVRYNDKYVDQDKLVLNLYEALVGVKDRGRGIPVDGIYSILGLLPYGKEVKVKYKPRICPECPKKEEKEGGCEHEENEKSFPTYDEEEIKEIFLEVIKVIVENGYAEPLVWHGLESGWVPKINKTGSTKVLGGIGIKKVEAENIKFERESGVINLSDIFRFKIKSEISNMIGIGGDSIGGGSYQGEINILLPHNKVEPIKIWGIKKTLENIKDGKWLLIPNKWETDKPFAIIAKLKDGHHYRIGIVELEKEKRDTLMKEEGEKITIYLGKIHDDYEEGEHSDEEKEEITTKEINFKITKQKSDQGINTLLTSQEINNLEEKVKFLENQKGLQKELCGLVAMLQDIWKRQLDSLTSEIKIKPNSSTYDSIDNLLESHKEEDNKEKLENELKNNAVKKSVGFLSSDKLEEDKIEDICQKRTELIRLEKMLNTIECNNQQALIEVKTNPSR